MNGKVAVETRNAIAGHHAGEATFRDTRGLCRKCSEAKKVREGEKVVRSTFDRAVCSEPLTRLRRTRAYGYSIVSWRSVLGGKLELVAKWAVEVLTTSIIFRRMQVSEGE